MIPQKDDDENPVCIECIKVKKDSSPIAALSCDYATPDHIKFIRKGYMVSDMYQSKRNKHKNFNELGMSLEKSSKKSDKAIFWRKFAVCAAEGLFDDLNTLQSLVEAVVIKHQRETAGKGLTGMEYSPALDAFGMTLAAISPKGYQFFRENFAARTLESCQVIKQKTGFKLISGMARENIRWIKNYLDSIGYEGPVAVGSDETVCVKALRVQGEAIVGVQGGDVEFTTEEDLKEKASEIIKKGNVCSNVSIYCSTLRLNYMSLLTSLPIVLFLRSEHTLCKYPYLVCPLLLQLCFQVIRTRVQMKFLSFTLSSSAWLKRKESKFCLWEQMVRLLSSWRRPRSFRLHQNFIPFRPLILISISRFPYSTINQWS